VVFILNRYFAAMGQAIETAGGHVDKFIGDGVMALFGIEEESEEACRSAISAVRAMAGALSDLNRHLEHELGNPLRIGIGLHFGPAIVGEMGHGAARHLTAVGDTVNTASRLESMTKDFDVQLVVSSVVAEAAGVALKAERRDVALRGRQESLPVYLVEDAQML
ncbi:MAG: adenylate/guanylate cyclase domain-containing protein, partial [Kiloniellales bacterium]|nr:adenylate/guanylate cyclase domain-containing protein [Kiloniellales bacterium]